MKLRRVRIENVRSFLDAQELQLNGRDMAIVIGPNGGGKTNLLDAVITSVRKFLLVPWRLVPVRTNDNAERYEFNQGDHNGWIALDKHALGAERPQLIDVEVEVTPRDIENMKQMQSLLIDRQAELRKNFVGLSFDAVGNWRLAELESDKRLTYKIANGELQVPLGLPAATWFYQYLQYYEADMLLRRHWRISSDTPSQPMLALPANRTQGGFVSSTSLSNFNEPELRRTVDQATSKSTGNIGPLAVGRLARMRRQLEADGGGNIEERFKKIPVIEKLSAALLGLGYDWNLELTDADKNEYVISLKKQGSSFLSGAASSGERELLTYVFGLYALDVRDALVVIDEPELHLHPSWQSKLLILFEQLSRDTNNQFLMATHSPVFVSPHSIQYVSRVYSEAQQSRIVRLNSDKLPNAKHLFSIVNSQNNEKLLFADKVVLVEGISDRLFFDAVFKHLDLYRNSNETIEIVDVGGKQLIASYGAVLDACEVNFVVIADLDYANDIGSSEIKGLFTTATKKIQKNVIRNSSSKDSTSLAERLAEAIKTGEMADLKELWAHIEARHVALRTQLASHEQDALDAFIVSRRSEGVFILKKGSLERYLPSGHASKDLEKLLTFISGDFWPLLEEEQRTELAEIANAIVSY